MSNNVDVVLQTFRALEQRDEETLFALYHPEVEFHHAPSLPYGGTVRSREDIRARFERAPDHTWLGTWGPLQPTEAERSMDPRVVAANETEVVVLYRQRALDPAGERFDAPVLGLYEVRDGRFARAQMFHFDTVAVVDFLTQARRRLAGERPADSGVSLHPNEQLLRGFHEAQAGLYGGETDVENIGALLTDDVAWHVPGHGAIAGDYRGKQQVLDYFARRRDRARGSLRILVHRVLADAEYVIQLAGGRAEIDGTLREWETVGVYRVADGRIAECWLLPFDQGAFDEAWV